MCNLLILRQPRWGCVKPSCLGEGDEVGLRIDMGFCWVFVGFDDAIEKSVSSLHL